MLVFGCVVAHLLGVDGIFSLFLHLRDILLVLIVQVVLPDPLLQQVDGQDLDDQIVEEVNNSLKATDDEDEDLGIEHYVKDTIHDDLGDDDSKVL